MGHTFRRAAVACAFAVGAVLLAPSSARAFCRTTTVKPPLGYDPVVSGCWTEGVPLAWPPGRVPYGVDEAASKQVTLDEATRIADDAFSTWNGTLCEGGTIGIQAYDDGPIASVPDGGYAVPAGSDASLLADWAHCDESSECNPQAHDVIVFDDESWPYDDPANTLALTTVTFGQTDGKIFEAYTEVNSAENELTTTEPPPSGGNAYDLQAILTHEAGHFLGLAHSQDTSAIMYAFYQPGAIQLTPDDVEAICTVYPNQPPSNGSTGSRGCSVASGDERRRSTPALMGFALVAVAVLRKRRRSTPS